MFVLGLRSEQGALAPGTRDRRRPAHRRCARGSFDPIDVKGVFGRRDRYVTEWNDGGQAETVAAMGVDLIRGHGRLDGPRRVTVTSAAGSPDC